MSNAKKVVLPGNAKPVAAKAKAKKVVKTEAQKFAEKTTVKGAVPMNIVNNITKGLAILEKAFGLDEQIKITTFKDTLRFAVNHKWVSTDLSKKDAEKLGALGWTVDVNKPIVLIDMTSGEAVDPVLEVTPKKTKAKKEKVVEPVVEPDDEDLDESDLEPDEDDLVEPTDEELDEEDFGTDLSDLEEIDSIENDVA